MRIRLIGIACILGATSLVATTVVPGQSRTIGQIIDDTALVASIKAKLAADKLSNLTKIEVKSDRGVVTLSGTVDSPERRARAVQIATGVDGVNRVIDDLRVAGSAASSSTTPPATTPAPATTSAPGDGAVDATGTVAQVDPATGTITLRDGRVLKATDRTVAWQPATLQSLRPGTQVLVRGATPTGFQTGSISTPHEWRMGTVQSVDRGAGQFVLTDGTIVRVTPSTPIVRRGSERLSFDALQPGSEVVVRTSPAPGVSAVDASEVDIVWAPTASTR
jgi:hypothetical protein